MQSQPVVIDENVAIRWGMIVFISFFGVFGLWAGLAPLSAAVIGLGEVKVDLNRKTIQHLEGGIIEQILVRDGDHVAAGQPLLILRDSQVTAAVEMLGSSLDSELAKEARLVAQKAMRPLHFPQTLLSRKHDPKVAKLLSAEVQLYNAQNDMLQSQVRLLRQQIGQMQEEINNVSAQVEAEDRAIGFMREELQSNQGLIEKGYIQKTRVMNLERDLANKEAEQKEHAAELSRTRQRMIELERQIMSLQSEYVQKAANDLESTTQKIHDLQERKLPSEDSLRRLQITAPVSGKIVGLRFHTIGGVVAPKEPILDLVPDNQQLIVEANIGVDDVDEVVVGMSAEVRVTAFSQRSAPLLQGKVTYVSPDRQTDKEGRSSFYVVQVQTDREENDRLATVDLQPGMQAEVYFKTRSRTLIDYLVDPITSTMRKSMRQT